MYVLSKIDIFLSTETFVGFDGINMNDSKLVLIRFHLFCTLETPYHVIRHPKSKIYKPDNWLFVLILLESNHFVLPNSFINNDWFKIAVIN